MVNVEIIQFPKNDDWLLAKKCALGTIGKEAKTPPSIEWKIKILKARHSPIRTLNFCFQITDIPYWVSVHLVRHIHAIPFVKSQRNDRQDSYDRTKAPQDALVNMMWYMNAEELMTIVNKRLCRKASPETTAVIDLICHKVIETNPEFREVLEPMCYYRGGKCTEFDSCGLNKIYEENKSYYKE